MDREPSSVAGADHGGKGGHGPQRSCAYSGHISVRHRTTAPSGARGSKVITVTAVTGGGVLRRYMGLMKPMHLAVLIVAAMSYFTLSALIAAPHMFGF
jgi:hypothetical protein